MVDIGVQTPFFYMLKEKKMIYDLFEAATGMQIVHNYFHIKGVAIDLPHGWIDRCLDLCDNFLSKIDEYLSGNFHMNVIITHLMWPTNLLTEYKYF